MIPFDYEKPELLDFDSVCAKGEGGSCYIDCESDDICPSSVDTI